MLQTVAENCGYTREREGEGEREERVIERKVGGERERLLTSVAGITGPFVSDFIVNFISRETLGTERFKRKIRLASDNGTG